MRSGEELRCAVRVLANECIALCHRTCTECCGDVGGMSEPADDLINSTRLSAASGRLAASRGDRALSQNLSNK
jgi:hypothetical protein